MLTIRERMVEMIRYFDWASARIIALAGTSVRADMVRPYRTGRQLYKEGARAGAKTQKFWRATGSALLGLIPASLVLPLIRPSVGIDTLRT